MADSGKCERRQVFLKSYTSKFPFIKECNSKGADVKFYARCTCCKTDIYIGSAGAGDIRRHEKSSKHIQNFKAQTSNQPRLNVFMSNRQKAMEDQTAIEKREKEEKLKEDTIRAEVMLVELIAKLNLSMNSATTLTEAFKVMFHDSQIAQNFHCGRTKATAIVKDLASKHKKLLVERMRNGPFSLSTDGSNDSNSKLYPIVVRTVNPETLKVEAEVVSLPVLEESSTGENIFKLLDQLLKTSDISWSNCVAFGCDNASVMVGVHKGVFSFIKKENPYCVLSGCALHLVHIAAEKASHLLPYQPADLLIDIFYYLKKSSVRQRNLSKWQEYHSNEQKKMLKHVSTRWLSIGRCVDRLVEDWRPLRSFFEEEYKKNTKEGTAANTKAKAIFSVLGSETAKLCALFMKFSVKIFEPFLTSNQSDAPMVQLLHESMCRLMSEILTKFVKPNAMCFKGSFEVEYELDYNIKDLNEVSVGLEATKFMKDRNYSKSKKSEFHKCVVNYYKAVCTYLKENLPHDNKFLNKISAASPDNLVKPQAISNFKYIMYQQPAFIPSGATADMVESQLCRLQLTIMENRLPEGDRIDERWAKQALMDMDTKFACHFLLNLLVVPHSSASCERVFSCVRKIKTDQRGNLGDKLLEALIITKFIPGCPLQRNHSSEMLQFLKTSCLRSLTDKAEAEAETVSNSLV